MLSVGTRARFWNTVSIPASRIVRTPASAHGLPSSRISPESGLATPEMIEISVLFPAPLSPTGRVLAAVERERDTAERDDGPYRLVMSETSSACAGRLLLAG